METDEQPPPRWFTTTHWSVVLGAGGEGERAQAALENLCRAYWYPLYLYVRRLGHGPEDAEDLTQGFFAHLLQGGRLQRADPERGRFRTFLLAALQNFLHDAHDHSRRLKRGGAHLIVSWDAQEAEARVAAEPVDAVTPEVLFERRWACALMERVRAQVQEEFSAAGKGELHQWLAGHSDGAELSYEEIATRLGTTEAAVKSAAQRLRRRLREVLWEEVAQTVGRAEDMEPELRAIVAAAAEF